MYPNIDELCFFQLIVQCSWFFPAFQSINECIFLVPVFIQNKSMICSPVFAVYFSVRGGGLYTDGPVC